MTRLTLQRNVQFLYEEQLARVELTAFGCSGYRRISDNPWEFTAHVNGNSSLIVNRSAYIGTVGNEQCIYSQLILPSYQGGQYNRTRSVNQFLTHWIYPYRGKFHPQMVRALLNLLGAGPGKTVLDPFLGSGTTALEASLLGANFVGFDLSPLCVLLSKVKATAHPAVEEIRSLVTELLAEKSLHPDSVKVSQRQSAIARDFVSVARMVSYSDAERRNKDASTALRRNLPLMLESVEAHASAIRDFSLSPGYSDIKQGDAREMESSGVKPNSVDVIVTSPPYSIALDYVKNDEHALNALKVSLPKLRSSMTGVRGKGPKDKLALYNEDMKRVFVETERVLKPGAAAAYVVGDATVDGREYTTTETMASWAGDAGLKLERSIPKIVFGLYNVMQDEKILVFRKSERAS